MSLEIDRARTDQAIAAYWVARDKACACERLHDTDQARAWWALASLCAREASACSPYPEEAGQLERRAVHARYNALPPTP